MRTTTPALILALAAVQGQPPERIAKMLIDRGWIDIAPLPKPVNASQAKINEQITEFLLLGYSAPADAYSPNILKSLADQAWRVGNALKSRTAPVAAAEGRGGTIVVTWQIGYAARYRVHYAPGVMPVVLAVPKSPSGEFAL